MKLSRLYCSSEEVFPDIQFKSGLNVIFARVKNYSAHDQDAHNLGKTFLTMVIDFCLLAGVDASHPFRLHPDRFDGLVFFLEVLSNDGAYITIRRQVTGGRSIAIERREGSGVLRSEIPLSWSNNGLGEKKARSILNDLLNLSAIEPYDYRKGLGYFLRRQNDYDDIYRITKFGRGRDLDWKPFMALLLGFNWQLVSAKYALDDKIDALRDEVKVIEKEAGISSDQLDDIRGRIQALEAGVQQRRQELDAFRFYEADLELTRELVTEIESNIGRLNERRYNFMSKLKESELALRTELSFDLDQIKKVFEDSQIYFSDVLYRDYEELVAFNKSLTSARRSRLEDHIKQLSRSLDELEVELRKYDLRRAEAAEILRNAEIFNKYAALQRRLLKEEEDLLQLRNREEMLDGTSGRRAEIRRLESERALTVGALEDMINRPPASYSEVRRMFSQNARQILDVYAILAVRINKNGNLDFDDTVTRDSVASSATSEGEGFSYQKLLCVCFDLALLACLKDDDFYRFVYHDGVFEALDNRRKNRLLRQVRKLVDECDLQYILTVIDSDLPRNEDDDKLFFTPDEIIRELHDDGDEGRLFRGPIF